MRSLGLSFDHVYLVAMRLYTQVAPTCFLDKPHYGRVISKKVDKMLYEILHDFSTKKHPSSKTSIDKRNCIQALDFILKRRPFLSPLRDHQYGIRTPSPSFYTNFSHTAGKRNCSSPILIHWWMITFTRGTYTVPLHRQWSWFVCVFKFDVIPLLRVILFFLFFLALFMIYIHRRHLGRVV